MREAAESEFVEDAKPTLDAFLEECHSEAAKELDKYQNRVRSAEELDKYQNRVRAAEELDKYQNHVRAAEELDKYQNHLRAAEELDKYQNHLRAAEEMAEAHKEWMKCLRVLLEYYPEMKERTEPISDQLREIFRHNA